jgi:hypothetical protein
VNPTDDIRKKYQKLLEREQDTKVKLDDAREKLKTAREVDVEALAEAALAGEDAPKRTEIALRHKVDDLSVLLDGIDAAVWKLQQEARAAVGEGHADFPVFIPPKVPASRADVVAELMTRRVRQEGESDDEFEARVAQEVPRNHLDAEGVIREAHRQREISLDRRMPRLRLAERPADLIEWVEAAYEAEDRHAEDGYERQAKKQRGRDAVEAVERAKREHQSRGLPAGSFSMSSYPSIILPEHLAEFEKSIARSPFEKAREARLPSHKPAQNEPVAEPEPVNEEAELRKREIAGVPPVAAPDVKPVTA